MKPRITRDFGRIGDAVPVPNLIEVQLASYSRFLQEDASPLKRKKQGFEALLREIFPIVSYDKSMELEFLCYELEKARYTPRECRELRLTYGYPLKIHCRLKRKDAVDIPEQAIYLGEMPIMIGGGEFIINGAERVIVNQLHRSPGVDFVIDSKDGDRILHGCRIIPERGSWIEISVTKKDVLVVRIDQSSKIPATVFLRAMDEKFGKTEDIIRLFYKTKQVKVKKLDVAFFGDLSDAGGFKGLSSSKANDRTFTYADGGSLAFEKIDGCGHDLWVSGNSSKRLNSSASVGL